MGAEITGNFTEILIENQERLLRYAMRFVRDSHEAQDIVQEAFRKYLEYITAHGPESIRVPRHWLYTAVRNLAIDGLRKQQREQNALKNKEEAAPPCKEDFQDLDMKDTLSRLYKMLSDREREVISLKLEHDMTYAEISEVTGHKPGYVGYLVHTGIRKLREQAMEYLQ